MNLVSMIPLLLLLFFLVYFIIDMIQDRKTDKKYKIHNFIEQYKKNQEERTLLYLFLQPILSFRQSWMPKKMEDNLSEKLKKLNSSLTPIEFVLNKIMMSIFVFCMTLSYMFFFPQWKVYIIGGACISSIVALIHGFSKLNKGIKARELQLKLELPEYMIPLGVMLGKYSTYEATKRSLEYASDNLRPYVEDLITQIELNPGKFEPYMEFAKKVEIPVAYQFMIALQQSMVLNESKSKEVIANQIQIMRRLRAETYRQLAKFRPSLVSKYIYLTLTTMMFMPLGLCFVVVMDKFTKMF